MWDASCFRPAQSLTWEVCQGFRVPIAAIFLANHNLPLMQYLLARRIAHSQAVWCFEMAGYNSQCRALYEYPLASRAFATRQYHQPSWDRFSHALSMHMPMFEHPSLPCLDFSPSLRCTLNCTRCGTRWLSLGTSVLFPSGTTPITTGYRQPYVKYITLLTPTLGYSSPVTPGFYSIE